MAVVLIVECQREFKSRLRILRFCRPSGVAKSSHPLKTIHTNVMTAHELRLYLDIQSQYFWRPRSPQSKTPHTTRRSWPIVANWQQNRNLNRMTLTPCQHLNQVAGVTHTMKATSNGNFLPSCSFAAALAVSYRNRLYTGKGHNRTFSSPCRGRFIPASDTVQRLLPIGNKTKKSHQLSPYTVPALKSGCCSDLRTMKAPSNWPLGAMLLFRGRISL